MYTYGQLLARNTDVLRSFNLTVDPSTAQEYLVFGNWPQTDRLPGIEIHETPAHNTAAASNLNVNRRRIGGIGLLGAQEQIGVTMSTESPSPGVVRQLTTWLPVEQFIRNANKLSLPGWRNIPADPRFEKLKPLQYSLYDGGVYSGVYFCEAVARRNQLPVSSRLAEHDEKDHALAQLIVRNSPLLTWCLAQNCEQELATFREVERDKPRFSLLTLFRRDDYKAEKQMYKAKVARAEEELGSFMDMVDEGVMNKTLLDMLGSNTFDEYRATAIEAFLSVFRGAADRPLATDEELLAALHESVQSLAETYPRHAA